MVERVIFPSYQIYIMQNKLSSQAVRVGACAVIASLAFSSCKASPERMDTTTKSTASASVSAAPKPSISIETAPSESSKAAPAATIAPETKTSSKVISETDVRNDMKMPRLVIVGDDIIENQSDQAVAKRIAELLRSDSACSGTLGCDAIGKARGGQLIRDGIFKDFKVALNDPDTNTIAVQGGLHDMLWWISKTPAEGQEKSFQRLLSRFDEMISLANEKNKLLVLMTMTPWRGIEGWTPEAQQFTVRLNDYLLSKRHRTGVLVLDAYKLLVITNPACEAEAGMMKAGYRGKDQAHPNEAGQRVIAEGIVQALGKNGPITRPENVEGTANPITASPCDPKPSDAGTKVADSGKD